MSYVKYPVLLLSFLVCLCTKSQTITGLLTTTLHEVPYGVEDFNGYIISNDGTEQYPLTFYADGRFEASVATSLTTTNKQTTSFFYQYNANTLTIKGSIAKGLKNVKGNIYSLSGQKLASKISYDAQSGLVVIQSTDIKAHQLIIATINQTYQLKIPLSQHSSILSNNCVKAQLKATKATLYDVKVVDPNGNISDKVFDANLEVNSNSFVGELQYAKNATFKFIIKNDEDTRIGEQRVIYEYNGSKPGEITRDTAWVTNDINNIGYANINLNHTGTQPNAILEYVEGATKPFKPVTISTTLTPGENANTTYNVESFQNQQITIQYENAKDTLTLIPGTIIEATYLDDNNRVETYTAGNNGQLNLEERPANERVMIKVFGNDDYYGHSATDETIITYSLVTKESQENVLTKGRLTSRRYLPDGTPIPAVEIAKMFKGTALTAYNDKQNAYHDQSYTLDKTIAEERYNNMNNWFGTNWNIVNTNNNPTREELEANFPNNTYQNQLTNILSSGTPETVHEYMTLPNGEIILTYGKMQATNSASSFYKEHMRSLGIYASDRDTGIMQDAGGNEPDEWELQIIPAILEYQKTFVNNYNKTLKNLID